MFFATKHARIKRDGIFGIKSASREPFSEDWIKNIKLFEQIESLKGFKISAQGNALGIESWV
ncbi:hypothetical protein ALGA_2942 [Labilibaculum antarcticum]|uniref:Uncharacterized protein n=1 Tax=Labilibaculum antarcticum TaxID=1717717 RepID=A0A1Y1CLJ2_9BACT|nr:hypothetical protein ALGA_2942 [Labilibaculum antarcticum]